METSCNISMEMVKAKSQNGRWNSIICLHEADAQSLVIVKHLHSEHVVKGLAKVILMAFLLVIVSFIGLLGDASSLINLKHGIRGLRKLAIHDPINKVDILPSLFHDLMNEGLLRIGDRAIMVSNGDGEEVVIYDSQILRGNEIDIIHRSNLEKMMSIPSESYDIVFMQGNHADMKFAHKVLKPDGVAVVQLDDSHERAPSSFKKPSSYNIVYLRQFDSESDSTIMAMRKSTSHIKDADSEKNSNTNSMMPHRRLFDLTSSEAKKAALKKLEDVLLEPPRAASGKSKSYLKKTRYLPDLMGDSLESYPRRVFINVGGNVGWFAKHYPRKNKDFEIYEIEPVAETSRGKEGPGAATAAAQVEMTEWLRKNVKEEEYVVMKAEAEVVEEIVRTKAIRLVDELFLECKHQGIKENNGKRSRRPYWECLALYGTLRDEGVAVHQWWG